MNMLIAVNTAIAGLVWASISLQRTEFDLSSLNPFNCIRRKNCERKQVNPLYALEKPTEEQLKPTPELVNGIASYSNPPNSTQVAFIKSIEDTIGV